MAQSSDYHRYNSNGYVTNSPPRDSFVRGGQRATIHGTQAAKSWAKNKSKNKDKKEGKKSVLYRSNSSLEMDSIDYIDVDEFHTGVHRDYGSTSSLDLLGKSNDSFFDLLKDYKDVKLDQRSPAPAKLQELLRGKNEGTRFRASNGSAVKSSEDVTDSPKSKSKFKHKDRKSRSKSITAETRPGIFTKLRGKSEPENNPKTPENIDIDVRAEERLRSKAFLHYDCQSMTFNVDEITRNISNPFSGKNTTTGASAASKKDGSQSDDEGDDNSNHLVLKCPYFRNEIGGEEERIVSLGGNSVRRLINKSKNTHYRDNSAILTRTPACCGLSILDSSPTPTGLILPHVVLHRNHVMEYVDHGASYYRHFFYGYDHQNYFGIDENFGPVAISIRREKLDDRENKLGKAEYGQYQHRIIFRTSDLTTLRGSILEDAIPTSSGRLSSSRTGQVKDILEFLIPQLQISCLKLGTSTPKTLEQLLKLDEQGLYSTYKVGVLLCRSGQSSEEDMYNNENSSPAFEEFLKCIGEKVRLKGFEKYRAQLDNKSDSTGTYSFYTTFNNSEIMFHVSTLLPYTANNKQQLLRKRHIGNDIVTIVFQEPGALAFSPKTVRSQFQHVFIIVRVHNPCSDNTHYSVAVSRSKDVPSFGPHIPEHVMFPKSAEFADFLMAKVINAENAAHKAEKFKAMATRTRTEYLKDLANNHVTSTTLDNSSKLSKFSLGSGRKKDKTKQKVIPDLFSLGTTIWHVQSEDYGLTTQVDALLGMSSEVLVVVEEVSGDVIFTVHCGAIIGWTSQAMSIRIYFNQGESILIKPVSGEMEETQEICDRLAGVTSGCETQDMTLKRNGLGQLGFHVQNDGIVTDVENTGFAYETGLRKGSRLVEVCKIAVATMTHEELVELLRTSVTVKVTVIHPFDDGTPRGVAMLHTNCHSSSLKTLKAALQATENLQQWQKEVGEISHSSRREDVLHSREVFGNSRKEDLMHSREISSSSSETSYHLREITLNTKIRETDESGDNFRGSMTLPLQKKPSTPTRSDMKNSPLSTLTPQYRLGTSSLLRNTSLHHAYTDPAIEKNHYSSNEDIKHDRSSSRDSSDYAYLISPTPINRQKGYQSTKYKGGTRWVDSSGDQSDHSSSMTSIYSATGYRKPSYPDTVQHGNIALELLKQSQNTKFLLNRGPEQPKTNLNSDTSFSSGSSSGQRSSAENKDEVLRYQQKSNGKNIKKTDSPASSANSSPKISHRNLYGTSSEESLNTRLRPGVTGSTKPSKSDNNFEAELKRLIDPEKADKDLKGYLAKKSEARYSGRLKRTMSDESLHNQKFNSAPLLETHLTDVIFTTTSPPQQSNDMRQSPRITREDNRGNLTGNVPLPESTSGLEWSSLVSVATKAIEGTTTKSKSSEFKKDNAPIWKSVVANPQQRITELEAKVQQLEQDLAKETRENAALEEEVQELRAENVRLQEESQQAAAQLRKFTEWFFKTIDRT